MVILVDLLLVINAEIVVLLVHGDILVGGVSGGIVAPEVDWLLPHMVRWYRVVIFQRGWMSSSIHASSIVCGGRPVRRARLQGSLSTADVATKGQREKETRDTKYVAPGRRMMRGNGWTDRMKLSWIVVMVLLLIEISLARNSSWKMGNSKSYY